MIEEKSDLKPLSEALESLAIAKPENGKFRNECVLCHM